MLLNSEIMKTSDIDEQLWHALQLGDWKAFETIYNRYIKLLYKEISKRIDDKAVVEDLIQDIFLSLWNKREAIQIQGDIYPYLYGMAINRVLNYYRSTRLQPKFVELWDDLPEHMADLTELSLAFRQAHTQELESLLEVAIKSLPNRMRQVYKLRYEKELSVPQIAKQLSTSPNTVHNQLKTIRKRFLKTIRQSSYIFF
ncbi:hypothetical protein C5745_06045 [Sphingobacterium haloxyli]|uniref:RNA polymerase subunit sigma-70 n=2 Tax=Sphingobacterium haloxyli TaxID=2100533 RepID=A0A2S9J5Q4_9SPHI|nr:hypothetical protein C5745_06045 [Sphingobacterium haloxyli]